MYNINCGIIQKPIFFFGIRIVLYIMDEINIQVKNLNLKLKNQIMSNQTF